MQDHEGTTIAPGAEDRPLRPVPTLLGALLAAGGALALGLVAQRLGPGALDGVGPAGLLSALQLVIALAAMLLCAYLALVRGLAAVVLLAGPQRAAARVLTGTLRVLAPRLARRIVLGASVATTAASLTVGSALAAAELPSDPAAGCTPASSVASSCPAAPADPAGDGSAAELPAGPRGTEGEPDGGPEAAAPEDLPPLGWSGTPTEDGAEDPAAGADPGAPEGPSGSTAPDTPPRTVVVRPGDTLWGLTDELLGPGHEDPAVIAASWPALHAANRDVVGTDPDLLRPGQVLTVPADLDQADLDPQEPS